MQDISLKICDGYLRQDGGIGIRNKVLIIYTVDCSAHVAMQVQQHFFARGADVDVVGQRSCHDHQNKIQMLLAYCVHPNVGAVLVIGNGCESTKAQEISRFAAEHGRLSQWFFIQDAGGTEPSVAKGREMVKEMLEGLKDTPRAPFHLSDLVIAAKCGGSDFTSGLVANPLVGRLFDRLADAGGTCLFAEMNEAIGLREDVVSRGRSEQAKRELAAVYDKAEDSCKKAGQFFIRPGNIAGGLTTIEEKSMSSYAKSGSRPIEGALKIAQQPPWHGVWLFDEAPDEYYPYRLDHEGNQGGDCAVLMLMNTAGCHLNLLITGRGHTCGTGIAPTIKITGNPRVFQRMQRDIDFGAGQALTGEKGMEELTDELLDLILEVCRGRAPHADRLGHRENEIWSVPQCVD